MARRRRPLPRSAIRLLRRRAAYLLVPVLLVAVAAFAVTTMPPAPTDGACRGAARCFAGPVTRIVDGDTLDVDGRRVRLALVDTPEVGEPGYDAATAFTASVCPVGSRALVDEDDGQTGGSFGRILAVVWCGERNLNAALVGAGHAVVLTGFCGVSEFRGDAWTGCP